MNEQTSTVVIGLDRWLITATVMLVTIIEILDTTIVNVALPPMMGELGASSDQITWVLTSYIVAAAIVMPLTGFLVARFGRKKLLLTNIAGFLIASMLCGLSTSLFQIVLFRIFQGIFGAALVPMSQYILSDIYSKEEQGKAMAIWGIGIMVAPILGPTLGGYITEVLNWRWVFYINLPVCTVAFLLALQVIKDTPKKHEKVDWIGLLLMATGIGCLQVFLDRGNTSDWFSSKLIIFLMVIWVVALAAFIFRGIFYEDNIINLRLFKNRNFAASTVVVTVFSIGMFGVVAVQPLMFEHLMGYTAELAGLLLAPRGLSSALGMILSSQLIKRYDTRLIMIIGIMFSAYGTYLMYQFNLDISFSVMVWPNIITGFGNGMLFVPLASTPFQSLPEKDAAEASGLFNFGRNLGASIGISLLSTLITRETQINWNRLSGYAHYANTNFKQWVQAQSHTLTQSQIYAHLATEVHRQSMMIAFLDAYGIVAISLLAMLPLIFLIQKSTKH